MDPSLYKDHTTSRGITYHYYFSAAATDKLTLLLLHGFPSTSNDWRYQVAFFKEHGYGVVVPDLLGYGGTDKPADPKDYVSSLMCKDLVEILDAEHVKGAVAVGHDWGVKPACRLANLYPDRFKGFAFLALGYMPPPAFDPKVLAELPKLTGKDLFGYWSFFSEPDAHKLIESRLDSFMDLLYPEDQSLWVKHIAPTNAWKSWLQADRRTTTASYVTKEEINEHKEVLRRGGFVGPLNWYKVILSGVEYDDAIKTISPENYTIDKPVFFGACTKDDLALPGPNIDITKQFCKNTTVREYAAGHWLTLEAKEEVNQGLAEWVDKL